MSTKRSRKNAAPVFYIIDEPEELNDEGAVTSEINAPLVWGHTPAGFVLSDIPLKRYEEVRQFIVETYLPNDLLCKNTNILEDEESTNEFVTAIMIILKDKCSICAIEEETQRLAAILILRVYNEDEFTTVYSRLKLAQGEAYKKIRQVYDHLNRKSELFKKFKCKSYLRCYLLAVHDDFRRKGIGFQLLRASAEVARSLRVELLMGIFPTYFLQMKCKKIGMEIVYEIYYVDWEENGEIIFADPGIGNYTLNLMALRIQSHE